eukprot:SAG25_NODE_13008_length_272_cov_1.138728_2_plen_39_part_01
MRTARVQAAPQLTADGAPPLSRVLSHWEKPFACRARSKV